MYREGMARRARTPLLAAQKSSTSAGWARARGARTPHAGTSPLPPPLAAAAVAAAGALRRSRWPLLSSLLTPAWPSRPAGPLEHFRDASSASAHPPLACGSVLPYGFRRLAGNSLFLADSPSQAVLPPTMGAMGRKLDIITLILLILEFISWLVFMAATGKQRLASGACAANCNVDQRQLDAWDRAVTASLLTPNAFLHIVPALSSLPLPDPCLIIHPCLTSHSRPGR